MVICPIFMKQYHKLWHSEEGVQCIPTFYYYLGTTGVSFVTCGTFFLFFFYQTLVRLIDCQLALSSRVMSFWGTVAIVTGCSSCRHQWPLWDSNPGPVGYKPSVLTTKPWMILFKFLYIQVWMFYRHFRKHEWKSYNNVTIEHL